MGVHRRRPAASDMPPSSGLLGLEGSGNMMMLFVAHGEYLRLHELLTACRTWL